MTSADLLATLKEFESQLPELVDKHKLTFRKAIEPMEACELLEHMAHGLMVPISRGALLEVIRVLEAIAPNERPNFSEAYAKAKRSTNAIMAVMDWLDVCRFAMTDATDSLSDQLDAEIRDAMNFTATAMSAELSKLAGPIWGELPSDVRNECRKAGM